MRAVLLLFATLAPLWPAPNVVKEQSSPSGSLKHTIRVTVRGLGSYLESNKIANPKFVLYLGGIAFPNLAVSQPTPGHDDIGFYLDRIDSNREQWAALLREPRESRRVALTVGLDKGPIFASNFDDFELQVYHPKALYAGCALFLVLFGLFVWAARASDVLREAGPPPPLPARKAYSLGRVQMAVWFFVVAQSFVLIWLITFGLDTIPPGVLMLIGISTATGLAAAVVDSSKAAAAKAEQKETETPVHTSFLIDILSDANGISFHRFQMAVWTAILVIVFAVSVWKELLMPDFSPTLLGLMGLSSGTYIGFKFPETKN